MAAEKQEGVRGALFSRLAAEGSVTLLAEFSGQGRPWLSALRELSDWAAANPRRAHIATLLSQGLATVRALAEDDEVQMAGVLRQGIDVAEWIRHPHSAPEESYMASAPVSYPMIFLTEMLLYWQWCHLLGKDAAQAGALFKAGGATGHSQGVVCALALALAKSDEHFAATVLKLLKYTFLHGVRVQQAYPTKALPAKVLRDALTPPTPMLSVSGLPYTILSKFIEKTNSTFGSNSPSRKLYLSLVNGVDVCMVTGHPYALVNLQALLKTIQADGNEAQDRIPFSKRKVKFHTNFMPVSVPFHCPLLESAVPALMRDLQEHPALRDDGLLSLKLEDLQGIPVWSTNDNKLLTDAGGKSIMQALISMQCVQPVQWGLTCRKMMTDWGVTHVVDFSRGGASNSLGRMTQRNIDGTGIQVLLAATEDSDDNTVREVAGPEGVVRHGDPQNTMNIKGRAAWMDLPVDAPELFPVGTNWSETFGPKLLRLKDGSTALRTRYTDMFNRPPLFVSGMTPCTAEEVLCSAVINAGYSVELAGGGQHTPALFRQRIAGIAARTAPGEGIHVNLLYLNPFLFSFQFPLCLSLKRDDGFNIECITIAAGVPGPDKTAELCDQMLAVGISKLGFKPGSAGAIAAVVDLAHRNPRMTFVLQWTGGRSGGHHCLVTGTPVRLFSGKVVPVEQLTSSSVLVGLDGRRVSLVRPPKLDTCTDVYTVRHSDGSSYSVSPEHRVTLVWTLASSVSDIAPSDLNGPRCARLEYWVWCGGKPTLRKIQKSYSRTSKTFSGDSAYVFRGTFEEVREHMLEQLEETTKLHDSSAGLDPEEGARLELGTIFEMRADSLHKQRAALLHDYRGACVLARREMVEPQSQQLAVSTVAQNTGKIADIVHETRNANIVRVEVDGDGRYQLGNGTLTHNSMEDAHVPLLQTYALIRTAPNILLVFGGGIGDAASSLPYLSGSWSLPFFKPPMPVDGLLYGSRVMCALEAPTAPSVKELIVATPGVVNEKEWEQSLTGVAGGVATVQSELGEPIHKIATRGVLFWREMDEKYFSIGNKDALRAALLKNKSEIINRLNEDFQKPYFGRKKDGLVVDLPAMTYEEVVLRLLDLFHPAAPVSTTSNAGSAPGSAMNPTPARTNQWIDITYFFKFRTWVLQVVSRFSGGSADSAAEGKAFGEKEHEQLFQLLQYDAPVAPLLSFLWSHFPRAQTELLSPDDEDFFILCVCMQPGKPVNFVPEIDETLKLWLKKDSLWFSEDLRSIPNQDVQRCAVLHSPVSARFSLTVNEPVKQILDGIHQGLVKALGTEQDPAAAASSGAAAAAGDDVEHQLLEDEAAGDAEWSEEMHALRASFQTTAANAPQGADLSGAKLALTLPAGADVSQFNPTAWRDLWSTSGAFWVRSLFCAPVILRNKKSAPNVLAALFAPRAGTTIVLQEKRVALYDESVLGRGAGPVVECLYDASKRVITVRIANPSSLSLPRDAAAAAAGPKPVILSLEYTLMDSTFQYRDFGLLIEQSWDSKVAAIVAFYRALWLGPAFALSPEEAASGVHTITASEVARFVAATSDDGTHETPDGKALLVPLDYSIVLGWTEIVTALIASAERIKGDLLALVHLSNEYIVPDESASPLVVGDAVRTVAETAGVWIEPEGQVVTISAKIFRAGAAKDAPCAVEVVSRFAIRPSTGAQSLPASDAAWFKRSTHAYRFAHKLDAKAPAAASAAADGKKYVLNQLDVATLLSKKWHDLTAAKLTAALDAPAGHAHAALELRFQQRETAKSLETTGTILLGDEIIANISSHLASPAPLSCPVLAFCKRKATAASATPSLVYDAPQSYQSSTLRAPASNRAYALASKDVNVIHLNPFLLPLASLPGTITHGMYSSARMRQAISTATGASGVLHGRARLTSFRAEFRGMVMPGTLLRSSVRLLAMRDGLKQVEGELRDAATDQLVLKAMAQVQQTPIAYLFTGQGSAQVAMGMELYGQSSEARAVWDGAERFLWEKYGFSLLHIVRHNPKSLRVHFARGQQGDDMKARYAQLGLLKRTSASVDSSSGSGSAELTAAELASLDSYTFHSSEGLLYATQFQQPAILLQETAAFADLKSRGVVQATARLAGHSLGEYCCLAACLDSMPVARLAEVVFLRGLTMQNAVQRDALNRSRFGMVAASPDRVGPFFTQTHLQALVAALEVEAGELLQIVNFNVANAQYVVAGSLMALEALRVALDASKKEGRRMEGEQLAKLVLDSAAQARKKAQQTRDGFLPLTRGQASIPLSGIDVPFHSRQLVGGVSSFRTVLQSTFTPVRAGGEFRMRAVDVVEKYVPNVLGLPFQLSRAYVQLIAQATQSDIVAGLLNDFDAVSADPDELSRLLLIELLAYQFASPVQWIKTQESLLRVGVQRFIEIGPQPTLVPMMKRSHLDVGLEFLFIGNDLGAICYTDEGVTEEGEGMEAAPAAAVAAAPKAAAPAAAAPVAAAAPAPVAAAPRAAAPSGGSSPSIPLSALHSIRLLISAKLKLPFGEVDPSKSLKALAGGKSAIQNEVLGDVSNEFKAEPEGAAELPLQDLAAKAAPPGYAGPGKVLAAMSAKNLGLTLPGGWGKSRALAWLQSEFGLDANTAEAVLVHALVHRVDKRLESEAAAHTWLATVAHAYAKEHNASFSAAVAAGGASGAAGGALAAAIDPAELENLKALFRDQSDLLRSYLRGDAAALLSDPSLDSLTPEWLRHAEAELDVKFLAGVAPMFDKKKIRSYDASWNWAKMDVSEWGLTREQQRTAVESLSKEQLYSLRNRATPEVLTMLQASNPEAAALIAPFVSRPSVYLESRVPLQTHTLVTPQGKLTLKHSPRYPAAKDAATGAFEAYAADLTAASNPRRLVLSHGTERSTSYDDVLRDTLSLLAHEGGSFAGKTALLTGCGVGSIGLEVARCLLLGGANVVVTTSTATRARMDMFRSWYRQWGGKGARLTVIPFNGASRQDCEALVAEVGVPDLLLPFAAISENGRDIGGLDGLAELAHRTMLTNVIRLLGAIKNHTAPPAGIDPASGSAALPNTYCHVLLPLSPNHGVMGGDGLYAESKLGLETLYWKWSSEGWSGRLGLVGAEIGWTKGTGLMSSNDLVAERMESQAGLRTFDSTEMAFTLTALLHPRVVELARKQPLHANLSGGFGSTKGGLPAGPIRAQLQLEADIQRAIYTDALLDAQQSGAPLPAGAAPAAAGGPAPAPKTYPLTPRACLGLTFPALPTAKDLAGSPLEGLLDLSRVPVIVGFGEVGPWGNSATRWERELHDEFTASGAIQLARSMGLIKYHRGKHAALGREYIGWVDVASGEAVADHAVAQRYGAHFIKHCGIRNVEPAINRGYDPSKKLFLQQLSLAAEFKPFEVSSQAEAEHLTRYHGSKLRLEHQADGKIMAHLQPGATIYVPKATAFDRTVAGQLPTGWNGAQFGLPKDILGAVDPCTTFALGAAMEALASAGLASDPYELYKHVHVSEVGNAIGSGMGGMQSLQGIFRHRLLDAQGLPSDQLQESFINTTAAWINMLLLSACGPITTPVAACATAAVSLELGVSAIVQGKAKLMFVGGTEDWSEEGSYEFAQMGATSNGVAEEAAGRTPDEQCRPCTSTRNGFMEAQGAGVQIICTAQLAIEMGLPIYAVVASVATATDRQGRSIPAPGVGILSTAREAAGSKPSPLLNVAFRRRALERDVAHIDEWLEAELAEEDADADFLHAEAERRIAAARRLHGHTFFHDQPTIAPLRGGLAMFGLGVDDLEAVSFHGTSTVANDRNESSVVHMQMAHLGRKAGSPLPVMAQKWLTGHPKGSAFAWMLNGMVQSMNTGLVAGNRNLDNPDGPALRKFEHLLYVDRTHAPKGRPLKAVYGHSFGFGQAGAEVVVVHANSLLGAVSSVEFNAYAVKREERHAKANRHWLEWMHDKRPLVTIKSVAPYADPDMYAVFLSPLARATRNDDSGLFHISSAAGKGKKAGASLGGDKSRLNLALRNLSKNISWRNLRASPSSQFLHVDSKGDVSSASPMGSPSSSASIASDGTGRVGVSQSGGMGRSSSVVWSSQSPLTNQNLNTEVPAERGNPHSFGASLSRNASEAALNSVGLTHSLSGVSLTSAAQEADSECGVGVDVEEIGTFENKDADFLARNFTPAERAYCQAQAHPAASFAGKWAAKEAVLKALSSLYSTSANALTSGLSNAAAPLSDIEVMAPPAAASGQTLAPQVTLKGQAERLAQHLQLASIQLSISHAGSHALSLAMARSRSSMRPIGSVADLSSMLASSSSKKK